MTRKDNTRIVELIERAERETPFCDCGLPMAATAEDRGIWLRCTSHRIISGGPVRRFLAMLASAAHTPQLLIDCA